MEERRKFVRVTGVKDLEYRIKGSAGKMDTALVKNISLVGVKIVIDKLVEKGKVLELLLKLPNDPDPILFIGRIIWMLPALNNKFVMGIRFEDTKEENNKRLIKFIYSCAKRVEEKRSFIRCPLDIDVACSSLDNSEEILYAKSKDISRGGIRMMTEESLEADTLLKMKFRLPDDENFVEIESKVIWLREKNENYFEVGVRFINLKSEDRERISQFLEKHLKSSDDA